MDAQFCSHDQSYQLQRSNATRKPNRYKDFENGREREKGEEKETEDWKR